MPARYTLDASVFINAFRPSEVGHANSFQLVDQLRNTATPIIVPTLLLAEIAGTMARATNDPIRAQGFVSGLGTFLHLTLVPLDLVLGRRASELAANYRLRGSDAVYAAVALQFGSTLVSRDREQRERVAPALPTRSPEEALQEDWT